MSYYSDELTKALGGAYFIGAESLDYGNWTPNGIRTLGLFSNMILVEYHKPYKRGKIEVHPLKISTVAQEFASRPEVYKNLLNTLNRKNLGTLEEIILDVNLGISPTKLIQKYTSTDNRLRRVSLFPWDRDFSQKFLEAARNLRKSDIKHEMLLSDLFPNGSNNAFNVADGDKPWYARYNLVPQTYSADLKDGALAQHFKGIAVDHGWKVIDESSINKQELKPNQVDYLTAITKEVEFDKKCLPIIQRIQAMSDRADDSKKIKLDATGHVQGLSYLLSAYKVGTAELTNLYKDLGYCVADTEEDTVPGRTYRSDGTGFITKNIVNGLRKLAKEQGIAPEDRPKNPVELYKAILESGKASSTSKDSAKEKIAKKLRPDWESSPWSEYIEEFNSLLDDIKNSKDKISKPLYGTVKIIISEFEPLPLLDKVSGADNVDGFKSWGLVSESAQNFNPGAYKHTSIQGIAKELYKLVPITSRFQSVEAVTYQVADHSIRVYLGIKVKDGTMPNKLPSTLNSITLL